MRLQGTWGLAILSKDEPGQLLVARNGSPLVVGVGDGCAFVASETAAFNRHTKRFISLQDGEIAVVRPEFRTSAAAAGGDVGSGGCSGDSAGSVGRVFGELGGSQGVLDLRRVQLAPDQVGARPARRRPARHRPVRHRPARHRPALPCSAGSTGPAPPCCGGRAATDL